MATDDLFSRILVGVTGTETSQAAIVFAIRLSQHHHASLILVHIIDVSLANEIAIVMMRPRDEVLAEMRSNGQRYLQNAEKLARSMGQNVDVAIRSGVPYIEIVAEAQSARADLIVIGSSHVTGPARLGVGRVVHRIIENSECPVLVVKHVPAS